MTFSADQEQFRDVVRRFLTDKSSAAEVRRLMAGTTGYDPAVWSQLTGELGLAGTHLPEVYGGFGFGPEELAIVATEMGRALYCGPFFASAIMAGYAVLTIAGEAHKQAILPGIASGATIATLVLDDLNAPERIGRTLTARQHEQGWLLTGAAPMVLDAHNAQTLIVAASTPDGISLLHTQPGERVSITPLTPLDPTRKLSRVTFADTPAELLGQADAAALHRLWDQLNTMLANEMVGGAERLFETTVDYLKLRVQFGRPIGSFQALKHRCADLLLALSLTRAAAQDAARYLATGQGDDFAPNMAKAMAADTYMEIARQAVQLRGGIGFTWEEDTHLWFKRAKSSEVFLGSANWHRERMMQRIENSEALHV